MGVAAAANKQHEQMAADHRRQLGNYAELGIDNMIVDELETAPWWLMIIVHIRAEAILILAYHWCPVYSDNV